MNWVFCSGVFVPAFARDALGVVSAMGYRSVAAVVGHDSDR
jgi:hypothetical protein